MAVQTTDGAVPSPLARLAEDYLTNCEARGLSHRTVVTSYGYSLREVFLPWCESEGIHDVSELDGRSVDRFTSSLLRRRKHGDGGPISKHTVHSYVRPVRQMLTWASRVGEDVRAKPQLPRCTKPLREVLSREEINLMEQVMPTERDKLIIRIFGDCGLRIHELALLTPQDIRRSGRQAHLNVMGKGSRPRTVPVPPQLLRGLDRVIASRPVERTHDMIFLSLRHGPLGTYDPLTTSGIHQVVKDAAARAGITKRVYPHLLRHSWMTEMLRRGMNPIQLSSNSGSTVASSSSMSGCDTRYAQCEAVTWSYVARSEGLEPPTF